MTDRLTFDRYEFKRANASGYYEDPQVCWNMHVLGEGWFVTHVPPEHGWYLWARERVAEIDVHGLQQDVLDENAVRCDGPCCVGRRRFGENTAP